MASMMSDELAFMSISDLGALLRERRLSPVELMDLTLARVRERNPSLNAFTYVDEEFARAGAKVAEEALAAGRDAGPLMGIPTAIKDLSDSRPGWPGTFAGI